MLLDKYVPMRLSMRHASWDPFRRCICFITADGVFIAFCVHSTGPRENSDVVKRHINGLITWCCVHQLLHPLLWANPAGPHAGSDYHSCKGQVLL